MRKFFCLLLLLSFVTVSFAQKKSDDVGDTKLKRPKLVVGIVVDQMRWDYLYRFYDLYKADGGFKRFLNHGFTCENTFIPYIPTYTAAGHTSVYTGSVPAINGIVGNNWYDPQLKREVYCSEDNGVQTVGSSSEEPGKMSPVNMLVTTVTDELRLATNFKSKVIGVAIKDRGSILPAGHAANAAYWYDSKTGNFITSTYYMEQLPGWATAFNNRKIVDSLYKLNWNLSLPADVYASHSSKDDVSYESRPFGEEQTKFPYNLANFSGKNYSKISSTPYGNTLTIEMAKAALINEKLGKSGSTDFLAVSFSSPDYIGHAFGPNSWEAMDNYIKLDQLLGEFFRFLDKEIGSDNYTVFLTADHGVAHVAGFSKENKLPGGIVRNTGTMKGLNSSIKQNFGIDSAIIAFENYQLYLNKPAFLGKEKDLETIKSYLIETLLKEEGVAQVVDLSQVKSLPLNETQASRFANGYNQLRSGDIQVVLKSGYMSGSGKGTTHGLWNPYDAHIPLLWYGWGINAGKTNRETHMTDIAATVSALLHIQMPSGCVGEVISEVIKNK